MIIPIFSMVSKLRVVAAVVNGQHLRRMARVVQRFFEIDHRVESAALADPGIEVTL